MARLLPFYSGKSNLLDFPLHDLDEFDEAFKTFYKEKWPILKKPDEYTFKLDVRENNNEYIIDAELPGVDKEEISVQLDEGQLNITVKRIDNVDKQNDDYIHKERYFSSTSRNIYLENTKSEGVKAKLDNGILSIIVPKEEKKVTSRNIDIE
ncbi:Hsp20/alpha crystallin family protein [Anaerosacchariphilus polymeriproducens]|uniref:Hsp20/alpha crystallin family protein n=1 Tax=Anaerosacchariphilus polymeriproducens TaxID=1812858 RepID=A0A371AWM3_9FIRM|nr:Hsp20/alpha crystallin family protein [Anaerosacchariphilus polymeriproducens]RDU23870.1 Hsp20/alpha crystallin family protein [Anaerosacchariphilus polymeriproducens]